MNIVKRTVFRSVIPLLGRILIKRNRYCNVIYYHDVVDGSGDTYMKTDKRVFYQQMDYIADLAYQTLCFDELERDDNMSFDKRKVIIAFDDGWLSNYTEIFEFMKSRGIKYNVFLTVGEIGHNEEYLSWDQVRTMHDSGLVGFGVHTYSHVDMCDFSMIDYNQEIIEANRIFEKELGFKPQDFCYPYGSYSEEGNKVLERNNVYRRIYTSRMMYSYDEGGSIIMGRNGINNDWSMRVFRNQLDGYYNVFNGLLSFIKK